MATTKEDTTESIQKELKLSINQSAELIETFMEKNRGQVYYLNNTVTF